MRYLLTLLVAALAISPVIASASPTAVVLAPSVKTEKAHKVRADIVYISSPTGTTSAGLTYGLTNRVELGFQSSTNNTIHGLTQPTALFNGKYRLLNEGSWTPALAVGADGYSYRQGPYPAPQRLYAALGKNVGSVALTVGEYTSHQDYALAQGYVDRTNAFYGVTFPVGPFSLRADRTVGNNPFGRDSYGLGYHLTDKIWLEPGYVHYRNPGFYGTNAALVQAHFSL